MLLSADCYIYTYDMCAPGVGKNVYIYKLYNSDGKTTFHDFCAWLRGADCAHLFTVPSSHVRRMW